MSEPLTSNENLITECQYEEMDVGKAFKMTKTKHVWKFCIKGVQHSVEFYDSKLTGKKKVIADGKTLLAPRVIKNVFTFTFQLDTTSVTLIQSGYSFELRINNLPFNHLLSLQKNKKTYSKNFVSPVSTSYTKNAIEENNCSKFGLNFSNLNEIKNEKKEKNLINRNQFNFAIKDKKEFAVKVNNLTNVNNCDENQNQFSIFKMNQPKSNNNKNNENMLDFDNIISSTKTENNNILNEKVIGSKLTQVYMQNKFEDLNNLFGDVNLNKTDVSCQPEISYQNEDNEEKVTRDEKIVNNLFESPLCLNISPIPNTFLNLNSNKTNDKTNLNNSFKFRENSDLNSINFNFNENSENLLMNNEINSAKYPSFSELKFK